ncbi:DUF5684 domain-containing protein [Lysinimonas soli]|uniref:DUF5684 domain-containing protein n=1 Tax=Lysinimonas soli TaxID=1074233 RepID=A0ABW0NSU5_9MICO
MFQLITDVDYSTSYSVGPTAGTIGSLVGYIILVIALWPVFRKAGFPGWGAIIPIYNTYVLVKIAGFHGATVLLFLIPIVNLVFGIIVAIRIGAAFGKGGAFSFFLLWLLSIIGYLIIGYGSSTYIGPGGKPAAAV